MGRGGEDWSEADPEEGEEGAVDVGASDGCEEVSLEIKVERGLGGGGGKGKAFTFYDCVDPFASWRGGP